PFLIPLDMPEVGNFTVYDNGGEIICRPANIDEATAMNMRDPQQRLRIISPLRLDQQGGVKIILRGTKQLDDFPQAKNAFLSAAAEWESVIQTPITIVIDVDYGPTFFGN